MIVEKVKFKLWLGHFITPSFTALQTGIFLSFMVCCKTVNKIVGSVFRSHEESAIEPKDRYVYQVPDNSANCYTDHVASCNTPWKRLGSPK